ncbi:MAG: sugar phosphate isomerase/epimerase [Phycisphaerae bacterium]|nr:sugar phosphate isomerase/epimerase [Phycisphaerae bacterium]
MKLCVGSWAFRHMEVEDYVPKLAKMGFTAIEFGTEKKLCEQIDLYRDVGYYARRKQFLRDLGMRLASLHPGSDFTVPEKTRRRQMLEELKRAADVAVLLGAPVLVFHDGWDKPKDAKQRDQKFRQVVDAFTELADYAAQYDLKLAFENHGLFSETGPESRRVCRAVKRKNFGVTYDSGNYQIMGEDALRGLQAVKTHINHVHLKDVIERDGQKEYAAIGEGPIDFSAILKTLAEIGYDGYIMVEYEGPNPFEGMKRSLAALLKAAKQAKVTLEL